MPRSCAPGRESDPAAWCLIGPVVFLAVAELGKLFDGAEAEKRAR